MAYILTAILSIILDQLTKFYIVTNFKLYESKPVIGKFLMITHAANTGGAFSILAKYPFLFIIPSAALAVAGIIFVKKITKSSFLFQLAFGLVVGGAVGNLIDRLRTGNVTDFIHFSFWPVFNVADIAICTGVGLLVIYTLTEKENIEKQEETSDNLESINEQENLDK